LGFNEDASRRLRDFFLGEALPYLDKVGARGMALADPSRAKGMFQQLRIPAACALHSTIADLETICEENGSSTSRGISLGATWLAIGDIPLSYAVLLLGAVHVSARVEVLEELAFEERCNAYVQPRTGAAH